MSTYPNVPTSNPDGGSYGADDVKLHRDEQPTALWSGAFAEAWELVKLKPVETLLLSFLFLMFNGGSSCNMPSGGGGGGGSGTDTTEGADWASDGAGALFDVAGDLFARIGALEVALIGAIAIFVITLIVVTLVLGTLVRGGAMVFWLRHARGQDAALGHTPRVIRYFVPLLLSGIATSFAMVFGFLALIVPGVIMALGWSWVNQVVVDKNLSWYEGIRASWRLTDGYKLDLLIFGILCVLLNFVGVLMCCVGVVVTNAVVMGASVIVYNRVAEPGNSYLEDHETSAAASVVPEEAW